jgi:hypothetical protein
MVQVKEAGSTADSVRGEAKASMMVTALALAVPPTSEAPAL